MRDEYPKSGRKENIRLGEKLNSGLTPAKIFMGQQVATPLVSTKCLHF